MNARPHCVVPPFLRALYQAKSISTIGHPSPPPPAIPRTVVSSCVVSEFLLCYPSKSEDGIKIKRFALDGSSVTIRGPRILSSVFFDRRTVPELTQSFCMFEIAKSKQTVVSRFLPRLAYPTPSKQSGPEQYWEAEGGGIMTDQCARLISQQQLTFFVGFVQKEKNNNSSRNNSKPKHQQPRKFNRSKLCKQVFYQRTKYDCR